jgi:hypothetical protein
MLTLDDMYPVEKMKELDAAALCDPKEQPKEAYPNGLFLAMSAGMTAPSVAAGMGFFCSRCKVLIRCGLEANDSVWHCGSSKSVQSILRKSSELVTLRVGTYLR